MESRRLFKVPVSDVVLCCIVYGILQCLRHDAPPCLVGSVQLLVTKSDGGHEAWNLINLTPDDSDINALTSVN